LFGLISAFIEINDDCFELSIRPARDTCEVLEFHASVRCQAFGQLRPNRAFQVSHVRLRRFAADNSASE
jgi:hypothetical protein